MSSLKARILSEGERERNDFLFHLRQTLCEK